MQKYREFAKRIFTLSHSRDFLAWEEVQFLSVYRALVVTKNKDYLCENAIDINWTFLEIIIKNDENSKNF